MDRPTCGSYSRDDRQTEDFRLHLLVERLGRGDAAVIHIIALAPIAKVEELRGVLQQRRRVGRICATRHHSGRLRWHIGARQPLPPREANEDSRNSKV